MVMIRLVRQPAIRPEWPRTSSAASGFFFCGMIELPVDSASGSVDEAERLARPDDEFLGQAREVQRALRGAIR
jgi:hypothetical protein